MELHISYNRKLIGIKSQKFNLNKRVIGGKTNNYSNELINNNNKLHLENHNQEGKLKNNEEVETKIDILKKRNNSTSML